MLTIKGAKQTNTLAATLNRMAEYLKGPELVGTNQTFAHSEVMDVESMCPGIYDSVLAVKRANAIIGASRCAWFHYIISQKSRRLANEFFEAIASGEMPTKTSPIYHFRARSLGGTRGSNFVGLREHLALLIKCWNAYVKGKPMKQLQWKSDEAFPEIILPNAE